nr:GNAT family N-acetyltransferase [Sinosporangium siamense]
MQTAHTSDLPSGTLKAVRELLLDAFDGEFSEEDWDHTVGGVHALAYDGDDLVGHGSLVQRRLLHGGRALRTGYVEGVAVRADRRRQGYGTAVMDALERVVREAYELGALSASDEGAALYSARGWGRWQGPTSVLTPAGVVLDDEDSGVFVLPVTATVDLTGEITCDWRDGDAW